MKETANAIPKEPKPVQVKDEKEKVVAKEEKPSHATKATQTVIKENEDVKPTLKSQEENVQGDDTHFTYEYILSTPEQKSAIDLTKHSKKLKEIITGFFTTQLVSVEIRKDGYTLVLRESFTVGDKRRLGRVISTNSGLKEYVKRVQYNNAQDSSGQLFKLKKPDSKKDVAVDEKIAV